jgi:hypothetical protein
MKRTELVQLIDNPAMLSENTLPDLKQIVSDFPCFHAARMLYLKNLAVVEDLRLHLEIKKMAIHIPDRVKLFMLVEDKQYKKPVKPDEKATSFDVVENFLSQTAEPENDLSEQSFLFDPASSADYMQWLSEDQSTTDSLPTRLQHQELIDSFIEHESERANSRIKLDPDKSDHDVGEIMDKPDFPDKSADSPYFTETLAYVYIKQKRYEKALEIIKALNLKYPEKNIYFADQIRFLEKLIIHTKK